MSMTGTTGLTAELVLSIGSGGTDRRGRTMWVGTGMLC